MSRKNNNGHFKPINEKCDIKNFLQRKQCK